MPIFHVECEYGHAQVVYEHTRDDFGCRTYLCACGATMGPTVSYGQGLTAIESGRPFVAWNLGPEPVTVRSHRELETRMKAAGLAFYGAKRGEKGSWV